MKFGDLKEGDEFSVGGLTLYRKVASVGWSNCVYCSDGSHAGWVDYDYEVTVFDDGEESVP